MFDPVPLQYLAAGDFGHVVEIVGCPEQVQRVREMGILDGTPVQMIRSGTPCIVRAGSQTICVRGGDLLNVLVRPGAPA